MEGPEQLEAPSTPKRQHMTRDERIEAQTVHAASWMYAQIAFKLGRLIDKFRLLVFLGGPPRSAADDLPCSATHENLSLLHLLQPLSAIGSYPTRLFRLS